MTQNVIQACKNRFALHPLSDRHNRQESHKNTITVLSKNIKNAMFGNQGQNPDMLHPPPPKKKTKQNKKNYVTVWGLPEKNRGIFWGCLATFWGVWKGCEAVCKVLRLPDKDSTVPNCCCSTVEGRFRFGFAWLK